jgi:hypothetical protein
LPETPGRRRADGCGWRGRAGSVCEDLERGVGGGRGCGGGGGGEGGGKGGGSGRSPERGRSGRRPIQCSSWLIHISSFGRGRIMGDVN